MKRLAISAVVMAAAVLLLLTGCADYAQHQDAVPQSPADLTAVVTIFADAPEPLQLTAQSVALERYATAQAFDSVAEQAEATREAAEFQAQQRYMLLTAEAQMTEEAHQRAIEQQRIWATQQSANATQVAQATANAFALQMTAQAQAIEATAQQRAWEATSTAEALSREATATAQYRADLATTTRQAWEGRTTATAEAHTATAQVAHATMTRQAEKREETLGYARDYGIPVLLLIIAGGIGALVIYSLRQYSKRPVVYSRNLLGDAEPMAVPVKGGGYTFVDLDRQPGPALQVLPGGTVSAPLLRSTGQEERTTARDQMVDAMSRPKLGGGHRGTQAPTLPAPPQAPAPGLRSVRMLRRLDQAETTGFLPPTLVASLAEDWEFED